MLLKVFVLKQLLFYVKGTLIFKFSWIEKVKPILVINKIDRLILELKISPTEAYTHLSNIIQQVNSVVAGIFNEEKNMSGDELYLKDEDDSHLYFSPELGNVVFASAIDGWAFRTSQFAKIYSSKLGIDLDLLNKGLWGDYHLYAVVEKLPSPIEAQPIRLPLILKTNIVDFENKYDLNTLQQAVIHVILQLTLRWVHFKSRFSSYV